MTSHVQLENAQHVGMPATRLDRHRPVVTRRRKQVDFAVSHLDASCSIGECSSNRTDRYWPWTTGKDFRPALTTTSDLHATSSHRGGQPTFGRFPASARASACDPRAPRDRGPGSPENQGMTSIKRDSTQGPWASPRTVPGPVPRSVCPGPPRRHGALAFAPAGAPATAAPTPIGWREKHKEPGRH